MHLKKEEVVKKVGNNIRKYRLIKSITVERLALLSGLEYSQVSRIERGIINTSIYQVYIISNTLEIPMKNIFQDL